MDIAIGYRLVGKSSMSAWWLVPPGTTMLANGGVPGGFELADGRRLPPFERKVILLVRDCSLIAPLT